MVVVFESHEFGFAIPLVTQRSSDINTGREDNDGGDAVIPILSECWFILLCYFNAENARLKGDHLWVVVEILIGGIPTVREVGVMRLFLSLG